jgi:tetratricopeptide (TPR) repeat protein
VNQQTIGAAVIGTAKQCIENGQFSDALELYWSLEGSSFEFDSDTRFLEATARSRIGQYDKAKQSFEALLRDDNTKGTVFRANVIREHAHVLILLDQPEGLETLLDEAEKIYKKQKLTSEVGTIRHLQGLVLMRQGHVEEALQKFAESTTSEMRIPDFVPSNWGGNKPAIDPVAALARTALAVTA